MTVDRRDSYGFFCTMECDRCGKDISNGEHHYHDNENGEAWCEGCDE